MGAVGGCDQGMMTTGSGENVPIAIGGPEYLPGGTATGACAGAPVMGGRHGIEGGKLGIPGRLGIEGGNEGELNI
jgi:hypothetical protein